ncbi:MAG: RES domain-containing protein [Candidatus Thiodiazotropha sp. (ex Epidulcina cf. delphinae)]|nr:RES domain-containing protein [Candidatus Thiodiazotropha sp. (ex Epidulcina cf. delphinae)]
MQYKGLAYRAHNPYWSFSPVSGEGAKLRGGRFNPKGIPALYLSLTTPTALVEYNQGFPHRPQPVTLCAYEIDCDDLLNLEDSDQRDIAGISRAEMACAWELMLAMKQTPPTWLMAERLITAGIAGIIVPSYAKNTPPGGQNIVFWDWDDRPPHQVKLIDDENRLPKNQDS